MGGRPKIEMPPAPPPAPDLADIAVRDASRRSVLTGSRKKSFITAGGLGGAAPTSVVPPIATKALLGQ